jgi:hypothetical protein
MQVQVFKAREGALPQQQQTYRAGKYQRTSELQADGTRFLLRHHERWRHQVIHNARSISTTKPQRGGLRDTFRNVLVQ